MNNNTLENVMFYSPPQAAKNTHDVGKLFWLNSIHNFYQSSSVLIMTDLVTSTIILEQNLLSYNNNTLAT